MNSQEVRQRFLDYFKDKNHKHDKSGSLIPDGDSTLLFTNAGMNQFKNVFLGFDKRDYTRATTSQKCVRAGGKHNDLENVGHTARHHTFFEMLGNFSFGDYFKKEAIDFSWAFLTKELKIPSSKLYVTVFETDDEAAEIWHTQQGVPKDRIFRFGEKDNFWRMGDTGPCGPCSEIFYDHGDDDYICPDAETFEKLCDEDRYIEIWNLVFMQYLEEPKGTLTPLPKPSVDTGMGLERLVAVMQGTHINYNTDLFTDIFSVAEKITGKKYGEDEKTTTSMRVLADHARATAFLIADGVLPANDGRGYVLRRILRRAIRYGRTISENQSLLPPMVEAVIEKMGSHFNELNQQKTLIIKTVESEEERFLTTLDQGTSLLNQQMDKLKKESKNTIPGETVFKLYDTYGFPADLTRLMAAEAKFEIDETGFETAMEAAREKARASWKGEAIASDTAHLMELGQTLTATDFTGYTSQSGKGSITALSDGKQVLKSAKQGDKLLAFVDSTPFYAESGGQVGDKGSVSSSNLKARVNDCTKHADRHVLHLEVLEGEIKTGDSIDMQVETSNRRDVVANHSATHLMHAALRKTLGDHVTQAGSLVEALRLRFDFTHNKPLTKDEIIAIEEMVNAEISKAISVSNSNMSYDQAIKAGAMALFGEKYGDEVRVITMGGFSTELCGGTHVSNTSEIRLFKIVSESGVSSGVRRIEALTGDKALEYLLKQSRENIDSRAGIGIKENWLQYIGLEEKKAKSSINSVGDYIESSRAQIKSLEKEIKKMKANQIDYDQILNEAETIGDYKFICTQVPVDDRKVLGDISEKLRSKAGSALVILFGESDKNFPTLVSATKDIAGSKVHAGNVLKSIAGSLGGKGGGKPDSAQGAVPSLDKLSTAIEKLKSEL